MGPPELPHRQGAQPGIHDEQGEERFRLLAAGAQNRVSSKLGDIWWAFMLRGVFAGVLGVCALIWPTLFSQS